VTQWAEEGIGRERGPAAVLRAWADVLVRPRRFFARNVAPGDQAPGLTFAALVVAVVAVTRAALVPGVYPVVAGQPLASAALWVLAAVVLVMPAGIHLAAALQTVLLMATVEDRAGVSETVQVLCYALAPCVLAGLPNPWVTAGVALWGTGLFVLGLAAVHGTSLVRGLAVGAAPAALVFGYGMGGAAALAAVADAVAGAVGAAGFA